MLLFPKILSNLEWFGALVLCNLVTLWLLNVCDFSRVAAPLCSGVLMLLCMIQQLCFEKILCLSRRMLCVFFAASAEFFTNSFPYSSTRTFLPEPICTA